MKAPTRALIVEDIESWVFTLTRAARRAGASEIITCTTLDEVRDALRAARFDIAILDVGLDPDDDLNADGVRALELIRDADAGGTRCILVTGWQGGDRMSLQSEAQDRYGVEWAYMKEKYDARTVIAKLTDLLESSTERRLAAGTPMSNLCGAVEPYRFERELLEATGAAGGVRTLYSVAARLLAPVTPLVPFDPAMPLRDLGPGRRGGLYWSRALATAVAVVLGSAGAVLDPDGGHRVDLTDLVPVGRDAELLQSARERNLVGELWEVPGLGRDEFAD